MNSLIYDYIDNVFPDRTVTKIMHLEDLVEMSPVDQQKVDCTYILYDVFFEDGDNQKYVNVISDTANMVIHADRVVLEDLFPSYLDGSTQSTPES